MHEFMNPSKYENILIKPVVIDSPILGVYSAAKWYVTDRTDIDPIANIITNTKTTLVKFSDHC